MMGRRRQGEKNLPKGAIIEMYNTLMESAKKGELRAFDGEYREYAPETIIDRVFYIRPDGRIVLRSPRKGFGITGKLGSRLIFRASNPKYYFTFIWVKEE